MSDAFDALEPVPPLPTSSPPAVLPFGAPRALEDAGGFGSWDCDPAGAVIRFGPAAAALHGVMRGGMEEGLDAWLARLHPEDQAAARVAFSAALRGVAALRGEWRLRGPGEADWRWIELRGRLLPASRGAPRLIGVLLDIGARKAREAVARLVVREAEHRAKNALATAQALVRLTKAEDPRAFARAVDLRLAALGRAHARLSAAPPGTGVLLRGIAEAEFAPYGDAANRRLGGPETALSPLAVQPVCMALHELVTNSAKYGALSRPGGVVGLRWRHAADGRLILSWRESGGPRVSGAPARRGFGLALLDALVRGQLGGALRLGWGTGGLRALLCLPEGCTTPG